MSRSDIVKELSRINEFNNSDVNVNTTTLKENFCKFNTTRNLQFWHDGSAIANHSHLLMVVNTLYDKAVRMSDEEYQIKFGKKVDVQGIIEKPDIYILARCPSDDHQLMYSDYRNEDIKLLRHAINGFHGDGPACELEVGQQKDGRFPCWLCPANFDFCHDLTYMLSLPNLNLDDRMQKIKKSECSEMKIRAGKTKLFKHLKKHEIVDGLHQRKI